MAILLTRLGPGSAQLAGVELAKAPQSASDSPVELAMNQIGARLLTARVRSYGALGCSSQQPAARAWRDTPPQ
jgi:hypothetical protein